LCCDGNLRSQLSAWIVQQMQAARVTRRRSNKKRLNQTKPDRQTLKKGYLRSLLQAAQLTMRRTDMYAYSKQR
jgi:hypothetical protein